LAVSEAWVESAEPANLAESVVWVASAE